MAVEGAPYHIPPVIYLFFSIPVYRTVAFDDGQWNAQSLTSCTIP